MRVRFLCVFLVLAFVASSRGQSTERQATVAYVRGLQAADGGFLAAKTPAGQNRPVQSSVRATTAALRALKYFGGSAENVDACKLFVRGCFDPDWGGFRDNPRAKDSAPDVPTTAVGILAVVELGMPTEPFADPAVRYLDEKSKTCEDVRIAAAALEVLGRKPPHPERLRALVTAGQNEDGTFGKGDGKARETGSRVVTLLRLGEKVGPTESMVAALNAGQRADGGFGKEGTAGSDLETCYRVGRAYHMLKQKPAKIAKLREFIGRCRNEDGGYGVAPRQPSTVSGTYYAGIILHWFGEDGTKP